MLSTIVDPLEVIVKFVPSPDMFSPASPNISDSLAPKVTPSAVNTPVTVAPADVVSNFLLLSYLISTAPSTVPTRYDSSPA